ncbi:MAG: TIGR03560 family F420-dependent LLM class oxidoreductase [Chloroflexi bacterium]|nr:MAG: TIGR03560 family F420-dependent LLM class oxidoreductase [Chloroflexota bacterium]
MAYPLRIGLKNSGQATTIEALRDVWRIADEAGFDHVWDFDHLASIGPDGSQRSVYEGWTLLAAIAASTQRVRFGCMVTGNTYRHPAVLAKMAVTVDHLSGGRLEFGIGAAWAEAEHEMYGIEGLDHRVGRLRESLEVLTSLWTKERTTFDGRYYHIKDAIANPKPIQKPRPPIWIGAGGDQMLQVVARYADVWNVAGASTPGAAAELSQKLDEACTKLGRDPGELRRSVQHMWDGRERTVLLDRLFQYAEAGFTEHIINCQGPDHARVAAAAAEALPDLRATVVPLAR